MSDAELTVDQASAVALGGRRRKGMWGIEFHIPEGTKMPEGYREQNSELILSGGL